MISTLDLNAWRFDHPWQQDNQVEQDLLLAQAMCEIASHPLLGSELVLRGGTALHKLFLPHPLRYSEDLDYVRLTAGGVGPVMKALTGLTSSSDTLFQQRWCDTPRCIGDSPSQVE